MSSETELCVFKVIKAIYCATSIILSIFVSPCNMNPDTKVPTTL